jgi:hypothetical protein
MANGEGAMFPRLLEYVTEPRLHRLVQRHYDDEVRHEKLYRDLLPRLESTAEAPRSMMVMQILQDLTRQYCADDIQCDRDVLESYLFIQVLEEHAEVDLPLLSEVFADIDPVIADVVRRVGKDETKHVKWCDPLVEQFATSPQDLAQSRLRFRRLANFAHDRHNYLATDHAFRHGLVEGGKLQHWAWLALIGSHYVGLWLWLRVTMGREAPPLRLHAPPTPPRPWLTAQSA